MLTINNNIGFGHCMELNYGNKATSAASFIIFCNYDSSVANAMIAVILQEKRT